MERLVIAFHGLEVVGVVPVDEARAIAPGERFEIPFLRFIIAPQGVEHAAHRGGDVGILRIKPVRAAEVVERLLNIWFLEAGRSVEELGRAGISVAPVLPGFVVHGIGLGGFLHFAGGVEEPVERQGFVIDAPGLVVLEIPDGPRQEAPAQHRGRHRRGTGGAGPPRPAGGANRRSPVVEFRAPGIRHEAEHRGGEHCIHTDVHLKVRHAVNRKCDHAAEAAEDNGPAVVAEKSPRPARGPVRIRQQKRQRLPAMQPEHRGGEQQPDHPIVREHLHPVVVRKARVHIRLAPGDPLRIEVAVSRLIVFKGARPGAGDRRLQPLLVRPRPQLRAAIEIFEDIALSELRLQLRPCDPADDGAHHRHRREDPSCGSTAAASPALSHQVEHPGHGSKNDHADAKRQPAAAARGQRHRRRRRYEHHCAEHPHEAVDAPEHRHRQQGKRRQFQKPAQVIRVRKKTAEDRILEVAPESEKTQRIRIRVHVLLPQTHPEIPEDQQRPHHQQRETVPRLVVARRRQHPADERRGAEHHIRPRQIHHFRAQRPCQDVSREQHHQHRAGAAQLSLETGANRKQPAKRRQPQHGRTDPERRRLCPCAKSTQQQPADQEQSEGKSFERANHSRRTTHSPRADSSCEATASVCARTGAGGHLLHPPRDPLQGGHALTEGLPRMRLQALMG